MSFISDIETWAEHCVSDPYWLAQCLHRLGRFGGQHPRSTVLLHSLEVHDMLRGHEPQVRLWALYHDANEVLSGEITRPFKSMEIHQVQTHLDAVLKQKLGITCDVSAVVEADTRHGDYEAAMWHDTEYRICADPAYRFCELVKGLRQ